MKKKLGGEKRREKTSLEPKVYECHHPLCEKVFLDRNSYRKHLITHGEKQVDIYIKYKLIFSLFVKQKTVGKDFSTIQN